MAALLPSGNPGGAPERITAEAWAGLEAEMRAGWIDSFTPSTDPPKPAILSA